MVITCETNIVVDRNKYLSFQNNCENLFGEVRKCDIWLGVHVRGKSIHERR